MNPLEFMRLMQQFKKLTQSPFADSLRTLAGTPAVTQFENRGRGVLGEYHGPRPVGGGGFVGPALDQDSLFLTPELFSGHPIGRAPDDDPQKYHRQPEYALAHEMGHRREAAELARGDRSMVNRLNAVQDSVNSDAFMHGKPDPKTYWNQSGMEHYAEAFANAVTFLRRTAAQRAGVDLPRQTEPLLAQADSTVPGTRMMVQQLLGDSLYSNHPLNQSRVASQQLNKGVTNLLSPVSSVVPNP